MLHDRAGEDRAANPACSRARCCWSTRRTGTVIEDDEIKHRYAAQQPYGEWLDQAAAAAGRYPHPQPEGAGIHGAGAQTGCTRPSATPMTRSSTAILPMAKNGAEPTAAMGADIPLAVLSEKHQPLFNYFKQLFAQVTNPPIDAHARGDRHRYHRLCRAPTAICWPTARKTAASCRSTTPSLPAVDLMKIEALHMPGLQAKKVSLLYYKNSSLALALDRLFRRLRQGVLRRARTSSSSPTAAWMRTISPSRRCWRSPPCSSIWSARRSAPRSP